MTGPEDDLRSYSVFIFFADVCQSTVLYDRLGDQMASAIMVHALSVASQAARENGGRVIDTRGDEILCLFESAAGALSAANAIHAAVRRDERMREHLITFRIGVHFGPIIQRGESLFGDAVNVAARLAAKAKTNQTVLSSEVRDSMPERLLGQLRSLGSETVRGKQGAHALYELLNVAGTAEITAVSQQELRKERSFLLTLRYQGRQFRLTPVLVRFVLGRGQECDLLVNHPSVSRHHAEIRFRNGQFRLFDMSTNGTHVITDTENLVVHRADRRLPEKGRLSLGRTESVPGLQIEFITD